MMGFLFPKQDKPDLPRSKGMQDGSLGQTTEESLGLLELFTPDGKM